VQSGDFFDLPGVIVDLFKMRPYLDVMDDLEVPRKRAKEWWPNAKKVR
jgi:hypothetical protein